MAETDNQKEVNELEGLLGLLEEKVKEPMSIPEIGGRLNRAYEIIRKLEINGHNTNSYFIRYHEIVEVVDGW